MRPLARRTTTSIGPVCVVGASRAARGRAPPPRPSAAATAAPAWAGRRHGDHHPTTAPAPVDLVLSSGFLAFAAHSGFLQAVEDAGLPVGGVMGTSAGALTGALWCAGHSPPAVAAELSAVPPIARLRPCARPWVGLLTMDRVIERLRDLLPPTFEDLPVEFAVGVVDAHGRHAVVASGPLPEAVAASAAIPALFAPVAIPGPHAGAGPFRDGGVVDRTGLRQWRDRRRAGGGRGASAATAAAPPPPALIHLIGRSSAFSGEDDVASSGERELVLVKSPKSGASLLGLGNFEWQLASARSRARPAVRAALEGRWQF